MTKKELQTILTYVQSGETILIKFRGKDGCFINVPIDNIEAFSDATVLHCHSDSLYLSNKADD